MKDEDIKRLLKVSRVEKDIASKDIAEYIQISNSAITTIESKFLANSRVKYIAYLRSKGVDLNALFDKIITE